MAQALNRDLLGSRQNLMETTNEIAAAYLASAVQRLFRFRQREFLRLLALFQDVLFDFLQISLQRLF